VAPTPRTTAGAEPLTESLTEVPAGAEAAVELYRDI